MLRRNFLIVLLCILFAPAFSFAQADNGGGTGGGSTTNQGGNGGGNGGGGNGGGGNGGGQNGGGGGRGNFDPTQMRQRMMDMMKDRLSANDDEWKIIQPKLEKVMDLERQSRAGGGFGRMFGGGRGGNRGDRNGGGGGGAGGPGGPQADNPVSQAMQDLNDTLDKKDATADEINQKLLAYRDARDKSRKDLVDAQKDLKDVLEPRQEAVLVTFGMLD